MSIQVENKISFGIEDLKNPLLHNKPEIIVDGDKINISVKNAYKYFNSVCVLVPFNKSSIEKFYFEENIGADKFISMTKNLVLYKLNNLSILTNKIFSNQLKVMNFDILNQFNHFNIDLEENNLVIKILSISFLDLNNFLKMYQKEDSIEDFHKYIIMSEFFKVDKNHMKTESEIIKRIKMLDGNNYWKLFFNLNKNTDYLFKNRKFQKQKKKSKEISDNYQNIIVGYNKTFDICNLQNKLGKRIFFETKSVNFTKDQATELFKYFMFENCLTIKNLTMFNYFLINPKLCHLVLNNYDILSNMIGYVKKNKFKYRYLLSYAWARLYTDEQILKEKIKKNSDIVFDINTASLLPVYPVPEDQIQWNPYLPIQVKKNNLNISKNLGGLPSYENESYTNGGICNFEQFQRQMNIFITGRGDANVFRNIDLESKNIYVVGSIIEACLQKKHVLLNLFKNTNKLPTETEKDAIFRRFCAEYYSKSDIDIMIHAESNYLFSKTTRNFYNELLLNLCDFYRDAEPNFFKLVPIKVIGLFVTEDFVLDLIRKENINFSQNEEKISEEEVLKYMENNMHRSEVIVYFKKFIEENYKRVLNEDLQNLSKDDIKYCQNFIPELNLDYKLLESNDIEIDYNIRIVKKVYSDNESNYHMTIQTKYKIKSPFLSHPFEIFKTKNENPWDLIHKFHVNCVRGYYSGNNVYLLPSCISAHLTYWNMDAKYFAGKKSPYEIINMRRLRGFGTILNKKEIKEWKEYSKNKLFWQNLYKITDNSVPLGTLKIGNGLFQPRLINADFYIHDSVQVDEDNLYSNINNLRSFRKWNYNSIINSTKINVGYHKNIVTRNGFIEPIDMSLVDSMTDIDISIVANNINVEKKEN